MTETGSDGMYTGLTQACSLGNMMFCLVEASSELQDETRAEIEAILSVFALNVECRLAKCSCGKQCGRMGCTCVQNAIYYLGHKLRAAIGWAAMRAGRWLVQRETEINAWHAHTLE